VVLPLKDIIYSPAKVVNYIYCFNYYFLLIFQPSIDTLLTNLKNLQNTEWILWYYN